MAVEYKELEITGNALVKKGAVGVKAIFKNKAKRITKTDDLKHEMHTIMYMVDQFDSHDAIVKQQEVIDKACSSFMLKGEKRVKMTHDGEFVGAHTMQLYIVPADHPIWKEEKYIGALATVTKFDDVELYEKCKSEGWETSLEGNVIEEEISEDSIVKKVFEMVKKMFGKEVIMSGTQKTQKDYDEEKAMNDLYKKYNTFGDAFWTIRNSEKPMSEKITELKASITQFMADLDDDGADVAKADPASDDKKDPEKNTDGIVKAAVEKALADLSQKHEALKEEIKKEYDEKIREIRKDFALDKNPAPIITTPVKKSLLS